MKFPLVKRRRVSNALRVAENNHQYYLEELTEREELERLLRNLLARGTFSQYHPVSGPPRTHFAVDMTEEEYDNLDRRFG